MQYARSFFFLLTACVALAASTPAFAARTSYFNMTETESMSLKPFPKWTGMMGRYDDEKQLPDSDCGKTRFHPCTVTDWKAWLQTLRDKSLRTQIELINDWSNEHPYIEDQVNWGMEDYWETPYEFMEISGDCEDYAISKYYSLRAIGVPAEKLRVIIVQDLNLGGIIHAILGVYDDGDMLILDNQSKQVRPAMKIYHYRPIYGVNEEAWWAYYPKAQ
jgi:predicted transglutaminase-like cysteine proteinase